MRIRATFFLALAAGAVACGGPRAAPAPAAAARTSAIVLHDWPVGLRPTQESEPVAAQDASEQAVPVPFTIEPIDGGAAAGDGGAGGADAGAVAAGASCEAMVAHLTAISRDLLEELPAEVRDQIARAWEQIAVVMIERCRVDGWSAAARQCYLAASSRADLDACKTHLTPEQDQRMEDASKKVELR